MALAMGNSKKIRITVLAIVLLIVVSCNSQNTKDKVIINEKKMEQNNNETHNVFKDYEPAKQLNIQEFDVKRGERYECSFTDDKGMEVYQFADVEFPSGKVNKYWEKRNYPNSAYTFYSEYDAKGNIGKSLTIFHTVPIGIINYYDISGNIIKKENTDELFKFGVDDLIDKMKDEYKTDILIPSLMWDVNRYVAEEMNMSFYEVSVRDLLRDFIIHIYLIDGTTGETLLITTRETEWNGSETEESIIDEYFNSLNK